jgi:lactoylglutathione lyase
VEARISLITIWTDDVVKMKKFYNEVIGFKIINDLGEYIEFENEGVRFAICMRTVMNDYSKEYKKQSIGQSFELAFSCESPEAVDTTYKEIISKGGIPIHEPQNMPWDQRTALFSDPDGNIHELFAELK